MKLYFAPRTRAIRPRWLLEELEVPYELVRLDLSKQENQTQAYLALSPFGELPVLVDGDVTLFESSAICLYLADRFPEKQLSPPFGSAERGYYYQWLLFAETSIDPVVMEFYKHAQLPEDKKGNAQLQEELAKHRARLDDMLSLVEAKLDGGDFLAGKHFSAADLVMASILHLANTLKLLDGNPRLVAYVMTHTKRAALRKAVSV
jgi:glutathione S-transferase